MFKLSNGKLQIIQNILILLQEWLNVSNVISLYQFHVPNLSIILSIIINSKVQLRYVNLKGFL